MANILIKMKRKKEGKKIRKRGRKEEGRKKGEEGIKLKIEGTKKGRKQNHFKSISQWQTNL